MAVDPDVLVLPAFSASDYAASEGSGAPDEVSHWLAHYDFSTRTTVPGLADPLRADPDASVALARTGIGKAAAATTVGALVAAPAVDLAGTDVVTAGIAGCPPAAGTVGSVFVADRVVDWDLKHRIDGQIHPLSWRTRDYVWDLDADLVERAVEAVAGADLDGATTASRLTDRYDDEREPTVGVGATVSGDELWHGTAAAEQVERLCDAYGVGGFVTTEMEDAGTAAALERAGLLDRYVSVRAVSNFDRPPEGGDPLESVAWIDYEGGVETVFRAGRAVVEALRGTDRDATT